MRFTFRKSLGLIFASGLLVPGAISVPVAAQQSGSVGYLFLQAVKEGDGTKATQYINQSSTVINYKGAKGESALHIVTKSRNIDWMGFLIGRGANVNIQDADGNTPLMLATMLKYYDGAELLLNQKGKVDLANSKGETPLIRAVQLRDATMAKILISAGADPDKKDMIAGLSARDYAERDGRNTTLLTILGSGKANAAKAEVYGPQF